MKKITEKTIKTSLIIEPIEKFTTHELCSTIYKEVNTI